LRALEGGDVHPSLFSIDSMQTIWGRWAVFSSISSWQSPRFI